METTLVIRGTHCASCKALIEEVSHDVPGVEHCEVDFTTGKTRIQHTGVLDLEGLQKAIGEVGEYRIESVQP